MLHLEDIVIIDGVTKANILEEAGISFHQNADPMRGSYIPPVYTNRSMPDILSSYFSENLYVHRQGVYEIKKCFFSGLSKVDISGRVTAFPEANIHPMHIVEQVPIFSSEVRHKTDHKFQYVLLCSGFGYKTYGHWLIEYLPKLCNLYLSGYKFKHLKFLLPINTPQYAKNLLFWLGLASTQFAFYDPNDGAIEIQGLLIPTTMHNGRIFHPNFIDYVDYWRKKNQIIDDEFFLDTGFRKFFISRPPHSNRALLNSDELIEIAKSMGLEVIRPENLSIAQQIKLFREASFIAGEYGSALHSTIWSRYSANVLAIRGEHLHPGFIQSGIGDALKQPTGYIFGVHSDEEKDAFEVSANEFKLGLEYMLGRCQQD